MPSKPSETSPAAPTRSTRAAAPRRKTTKARYTHRAVISPTRLERLERLAAELNGLSEGELERLEEIVDRGFFAKASCRSKELKSGKVKGMTLAEARKSQGL